MTLAENIELVLGEYTGFPPAEIRGYRSTEARAGRLEGF